MSFTLSTSELVRRAVHILRNKVAGLEWNYFDVNLAQQIDGEDTAIFRVLEQRGTEYKWPTDQPYPSRQKVFSALFAMLNQHPQVSVEVFRRIFDLDAIPNQSGAFSGRLGDLNEKEQSERTKRFLQLLRQGACPNRVVVLAEGDSWFQFPRISWGPFKKDVVRDILDHLIDREDMCLESIAAGGDWLSNMLHSREYIDVLSQLEPDVLLFSGGGNDLLGEGRAGNMVVHKRRAIDDLRNGDFRLDLWKRRKCQYSRRYHSRRTHFFDEDRFTGGLRVLADEFFQFLNLVFVQYLLFLQNLRQTNRFRSMLVVTQGYDFAVPKAKSTAPFWAIRRYVNHIAGSGKWLWVPFAKKELDDTQMKNAAYAMVFEFNELLVSIAKSGRFSPLAHIDCRGLAESDEDWYDEIHLTSKAFKRVAELYVLCMHDWLAPEAELCQVYSVDHNSEAEAAWNRVLPPRR